MDEMPVKGREQWERIVQIMEERKIAIQATGVEKVYKLYDKPSDRLKEALGLSGKKKYREHYALIIIIFPLVKIITLKFFSIIGIPISIQIVYLHIFAFKFPEPYSDEIPCVLDQ